MEVEITDSFALLAFLKGKEFLPKMESNCNFSDKKHWWWPNALSFEVVVGAILVQNTRWEQVEFALDVLKAKSVLNVESLSEMPQEFLQEYLRNIGFFRQKAVRLQMLCCNILSDFGDYPNFCESVDREWLLGQKGIGFESADVILNYALGREIMVADAYTYKLLKSFGYTLESYEAMQEWLIQGVIENYAKVCTLYGFMIPLNLLFARFHGKIVEYAKNLRRK
ncbi:3-methyladenine DNA glycosylase [Helicobacter turcicus]|uniref:3-methyladenine DNA glycosylase n=1 Tax=Helicobacter turcicus TaxID=2867412 RepID=A0ABS7JMV5_9HELI|nr:3-methyladenine DNA glycosylase [Helicobacter turcicus]MBX7490723.1 3-methyladenine DNA glycosylase [Helicobacter turcicus]MBX7545668.1 3-methyladenine DNA glycosylase [Helicobacter turcicus]